MAHLRIRSGAAHWAALLFVAVLIAAGRRAGGRQGAPRPAVAGAGQRPGSADRHRGRRGPAGEGDGADVPHRARRQQGHAVPLRRERASSACGCATPTSRSTCCSSAPTASSIASRRAPSRCRSASSIREGRCRRCWSFAGGAAERLGIKAGDRVRYPLFGRRQALIHTLRPLPPRLIRRVYSAVALSRRTRQRRSSGA